ncbi:MAG TPA: hypothetical protein VOA41_21245 [Candidatus Dormibacteraeota bacterium]|nr:hypothetical protein [Candidatus Dormibacteraeota bacterium]
MKQQQECATQAVRLTICAAILCFPWLAANQLVAAAPQANSVASVNPPNKVAARESPFYCSIEKTLTKAEREHKKQLALKMAGARLETTELVDGYQFRFRPEGLSLVELADWVTTESRCCPFFALELGVEREGGPVWLRVKGREGVKQFIRGEFKLLKVH